MLLEEGKRDAQHHHPGDNGGGARIAEKIGHRRQGQQQEIERVLRPADQLFENRLPALVGNKVRAKSIEPGCSRLGGQTLVCRIQLFQEFFGFRGSGVEQPLCDMGVPVAMRRR